MGNNFNWHPITCCLINIHTRLAQCKFAQSNFEQHLIRNKFLKNIVFANIINLMSVLFLSIKCKQSIIWWNFCITIVVTLLFWTLKAESDSAPDSNVYEASMFCKYSSIYQFWCRQCHSKNYCQLRSKFRMYKFQSHKWILWWLTLLNC